MVDIATFFAQHDRIQVDRAGQCDEQGQYVLYWMQRAQRGRDNHALNAAIMLANELRLPVVVVFVVADYPAANLRHYQFMLEGLALTARHLQERGTPLVIRRGEPPREIVRMADELHAAAVICDEGELRIPRQWRQEVAQELTVPFVCVDADGYTGIAWAIGGKHDRPWPPERPVFGLIRYMALSGMQREMDTRAYIYQNG